MEIVMMCGLPASGKSSIVEDYKSRGYKKLSRDVVGGSSSGAFTDSLKNLIRQKTEKIILDNTHPTKESREPFILLGKNAGYRMVCVHLTTKIEDAMVNAVGRMVQRHGKLFTTADDYAKSKDPNMFPIATLYSMKKKFEEPTASEGFDEIKTIKFTRTPKTYTNKAVIFDYDGTLRETKSGAKFPTDPEDIRILPGRSEKIAELKKQGYIILGVSNQSGVAKGQLTAETAHKCFQRTNELLGHDIDYRFCGHSVPPIVCYCRKPGVGFGIELMEKYQLDPAQTIMVGDMKTDETFAKRCGFKYVDVNKFFSR
jgi:D-glycero-D-manno-heptose 1,7-bisphosphate phosphatase